MTLNPFAPLQSWVQDITWTPGKLDTSKTQDAKDRRKFWIHAFHEAGHAVVADSNGLPVDSITVCLACEAGSHTAPAPTANSKGARDASAAGGAVTSIMIDRFKYLCDDLSDDDLPGLTWADQGIHHNPCGGTDFCGDLQRVKDELLGNCAAMSAINEVARTLYEEWLASDRPNSICRTWQFLKPK